MLNPKKTLGQNFLIDKNIIKKIVLLGKIKKADVLEIGAGTGNLTNEILKHAPRKIILVEKDFKLCQVLNEKFNIKKGIEILNNDILNLNIENKINKNCTIFGNLPYNISTQILVKLIKLKVWPPKYKKLIFMFQKEVAERILAKHNSSQYGRLSIMTNWRLKITDSFRVSKNCFYPKPKVDSTIIVFEPVVNKIYKIKNINNLEKITQIFFSRKRKMINKGFSKLFKNSLFFSKKLNIDLTLRPSQISRDHYFKITECYEKYGKNIK